MSATMRKMKGDGRSTNPSCLSFLNTRIREYLNTLFIAILLTITGSTVMAQSAKPPTHLRVEYLDKPLGLDVEKPRFSWYVNDSRRGAKQTAYRILVSTSLAGLKSPKPEMWDSGTVGTDQSIHVSYNGKPLASGTRYYWTVKTWDGDGFPTGFAPPSWWDTGFFKDADWIAKWIAASGAKQAASENVKDVKWVWFPEVDPSKDPPNATRYFRTVVDVKPGQQIKNAMLYAAVDNDLTAYVNGQEVGQTSGWASFASMPIADQLKPGPNVIAIAAKNAGGPAGMAALLKITCSGGNVRCVTGDAWLCSEAGAAGWNERADSPSGKWVKCAVVHSMGEEPWKTPSLSPQGDTTSPLLRKEFSLDKPVASARVYATALGSYRLHINGKRVGEDILTPDWTDYRKRVTYQCYDVTGLLKQGPNAIAAMLGDGWYGSGLGWTLQRFCFGPPPIRMMAQIDVKFADGSSKSIATDETWKTADGPILRSELYAGETYDARREQSGWDKPGFKDTGWKAVTTLPNPTVPKDLKTRTPEYLNVMVQGQRSETIQVTEELKPVSVKEMAKGTFVYDFGQNMVGWCRLKVKGPAGTKVKMHFAEILKPDGNIYTDNLRRAECTDYYTLKGSSLETWEPAFTYHGFRYVEVTGYPGTPGTDALTGRVFHSNMPISGTINTSSPLVNQIQHNIRWGQRGNHHSVPTDCPQRDERLGWMGDAEIFSRTGCYNMDMAAFYSKFARDMMDAQGKDGSYSDVSPRVIDESDSAPAWADAGVIVPYEVFRQYGDTRIVDENWQAMEMYLAMIQKYNPNMLWQKHMGNNFGDWVPANSETPKDVIGTAYWAYDARLMFEMAKATGRTAEAAKYAKMYNDIKLAFIKAFIKPDGTVGNGSQTCQALAIHMGLYSDLSGTGGLPTPLYGAPLRAIADVLVKDIEKRNMHLSTGFVGTCYLMRALSMAGRDDVAYQLLLNDTFPSWGYTISKGATTIWERWNGDTGDPGMNSYNHYSFGAVGEWLFRYLAGIDTEPGAAYKHITIRPHVDSRLTAARTEYDSMHGRVLSEWIANPGDPFMLNVTIPANSTAVIHVPAKKGQVVTEGDKPAGNVRGLRYAGEKDGAVLYAVGAGTYKFAVK